MKVRDSGMPAEEMWESFFDPPAILKKLGINSRIQNVVEFGSGYGTFSLAAANIISGNLYAIDLEINMIELLRNKIVVNNISNINVIQRDFVTEGTGIENYSIDYVMMFNILHAEEPEELLREAYRILRTGGKIGIIHWIYSSDTPRGPSLDMRPKPEQCIEWLMDSGYRVNKKVIDLPPYHYGLIAKKEN